jgi:cysteinyl-tRNA synthetase
MKLYSTLSRRLEELPAPPGPIRMYVCGPTVYQRAHIGNARPFVIGMWLRRWLALRGYDVTFVHNITDVNDKIYDAAPGASAELAAKATQWYIDDIADFGLGLPDELPKATEAVTEIVRFIDDLVAGGFAYEVAGDVYFRVSSDPGYGRLSRQRVDEMQEEERNPRKEAPQDFALWKATKPGEDTSWESPWGMGRPGWHIECSAMAREAFGPVFEIHGGGLDLVFPHHENEIAQSSALGDEFAKIWMHNGMLSFGGEKMSKSLGNDVSARNVLDTWGREVALLFFMSAHWRKPIDFTDDTLAQAKAQIETLRNFFVETPVQGEPVESERLVATLDDDFNTPDVLALVHEWRSRGLAADAHAALDVFGLASLAERSEAPRDVVDLAEARQRAREARDFAEADRLRDEIAALGWEARDAAGGYELVPRR